MAKIKYYKKKIEIVPTKPATILGNETEDAANKRLQLATKHSKKKMKTRIKANDVNVGSNNQGKT